MQGEGEGHGGGGSDSPIKGWMSFADIAAMTGIPLEEFTAEWGVPAEDLGLPMKDIKDQLRLLAGGRPRVGGGPPRRVTGVRPERVSRAAGPCYTTRPRPPARRAAAASRRGGRAVECGGLENR